MASVGSKLVVRRVIGCEILAITLGIVLIWLDEIIPDRSGAVSAMDSAHTVHNSFIQM